VLNRIVLIGRLATDPELKYTPSGTAVTTFVLAVDRNRANAQGERETDFIRIVTWQKLAETVANYLTKGRLAAIDGRLQIRTWVAQDGGKRSIAEVVAENLRFLDRPKEHGEAAQQPADEAAGVPEAAPMAPDFEDPFAEE
jgi:single-strand DNA-binding protein